MGIRLIFLNLLSVTDPVISINLIGLIYALKGFQEIALKFIRPYRKPTLVGK